MGIFGRSFLGDLDRFEVVGLGKESSSFSGTEASGLIGGKGSRSMALLLLLRMVPL